MADAQRPACSHLHVSWIVDSAQLKALDASPRHHDTVVCAKPRWSAVAAECKLSTPFARNNLHGMASALSKRFQEPQRERSDTLARGGWREAGVQRIIVA